MPSDFSDGAPMGVDGAGFESVECLLFDSLIHHLIEKGVLTKNDALSVVQTAAEVVAGQNHETQGTKVGNGDSLSALKRLYSSFEALAERTAGTTIDGEKNVRVLRPPVHGDRPRFPSDDN